MADIDEKRVVTAPTEVVDTQEKPNVKKEEDIQGESYDFAVEKDGVRMHPQPTSDPLDPLNWSSFKKHSILGIVMFKYDIFSQQVEKETEFLQILHVHLYHNHHRPLVRATAG